MWGQDKVWLYYLNDIIAADIYSAVFLASYLRYIKLQKSYILNLEVIDLQKYKIIKKANKVREALLEKQHVPFVFVTCKN